MNTVNLNVLPSTTWWLHAPETPWTYQTFSTAAAEQWPRMRVTRLAGAVDGSSRIGFESMAIAITRASH